MESRTLKRRNPSTMASAMRSSGVNRAPLLAVRIDYHTAAARRLGLSLRDGWVSKES
ncbi:hypothetical protein IG631_24073 [Alternaria alternata]|nr:hypothetical protein IG631_24073 [Alternaria alternata]